MKLSRCSKCKKELPDRQLYQYIDGNNIAITKNSPYYCWRCYNEKYPSDRISYFEVLRSYGHSVIVDYEERTVIIDDKQYTIDKELATTLQKEYKELC